MTAALAWCLLAFVLALVACTAAGILADERAERQARREAEEWARLHPPQAWRGKRGRA